MKALAIFCFAIAPVGAETVTVFAAISLTEALKEVGTTYEKETGDKLVFNFAGSNTLSQQIRAGAPADVIFPADEAKMDWLAKQGLIDKATRRDLLGNTLVVITPTDGMKISGPADLKSAKIRYLSIGDPAAVPAGIYAKVWLEKSGVWPGVKSRIAPAENVRAALAVVESGNAEAGIVYKTDAAVSKKVRVAYEIPAVDGPRIVYPAAVVTDSRQPAAARKFLEFLAGGKAAGIFAKFGFSRPVKPAE